MRAHAILSSSSAHRWLECTPSALLCDAVEDTPSEFALEGTKAHEIAEYKLNNALEALDYGKKELADVDTLEQECAQDTEKEMLENIDVYMNAILEKYLEIKKKNGIAPLHFIETRLDFSEWIPDGFGTADAMLYDEKDKKLYLFDLKYGKGVKVDATNNPQLMIYALGALERLKLIGEIEKIELFIIQPRLDNISSFFLTTDELLEFGEKVKEKALLAIKGEGEFKPSEKACKFCKVKAKCKARADKLMELYFEEPVQNDKIFISDEDIATYYERGKELSSWYEDLVAEMFGRMMKGTKIKGYKLAKGRKTRNFIDAEKAIGKLCTFGFDKSLFYETKALALTKIEKLVGAKTFKEISDEITIKEGNPVIVEENSIKEEYLPLEDAFK